MIYLPRESDVVVVIAIEVFICKESLSNLYAIFSCYNYHNNRNHYIIIIIVITNMSMVIIGRIQRLFDLIFHVIRWSQLLCGLSRVCPNDK